MLEGHRFKAARAAFDEGRVWGLDSQKIVLASIVIAIGAGLWLIGGLIAPVIASVVIAYILDGIALELRSKGMPKGLVAAILTGGFIALVTAGLFMAAPLLVAQAVGFTQRVPALASDLQVLILAMSENFDGIIDEAEIRNITREINQWLVSFGQGMVMYSLQMLPSLASIAMYLLIVPLMLYFLIKDRDEILRYIVGFLPEDRPLANEVWAALSLRLGGFVRGKAYEIIIVGGASYVAFNMIGLQFAALLATISGLSALIPYFGAPAAGVIVGLVAFSQFGLEADEFYWVMIAYTIIQVIDGTVLATVLLASTVRLHPIVVMVAILIAGDLLGVWGLLFAVPLASALEVLIDVWRKRRHEEDPSIADDQHAERAGT